LSAVQLDLVELRPEDTHALRRAVLRTGTPSEEVVFDGDELESTFHLGIRADDDIVAISTWMERPYPDRAGDRGFQLRGMATVETLRGSGSARACSTPASSAAVPPVPRWCGRGHATPRCRSTSATASRESGWATST
jgi:hypothetical protein